MSDIGRDYSFGGWVREWRTNKNITLREASERLKMDPGNFSKLERSEFSPPKDKLGVLRIARALDFDERQTEFLISLAFQYHLAQMRLRFK